MQFDQTIQKYIDGSEFSSGLVVPIAERNCGIPLRCDLIQQCTSQSRVVHVGFCDHLSLIDRKIQEGTWLHAKLMKSSARCFGIDINQEAVAYCQSHCGIRDVRCADLLNDAIPELSEEHWDYLILGEILEHIDNPVLFLRTIHERFGRNVAKIIISVPNAFRYANYRLACKHQECINSDHRYWFTPYTLAKVMHHAGMSCKSFQFCEEDSFRLPWLHQFRPRTLRCAWRLKKYPALRNVLLMIGSV